MTITCGQLCYKPGSSLDENFSIHDQPWLLDLSSSEMPQLKNNYLQSINACATMSKILDKTNVFAKQASLLSPNNLD